jgi:hypothetical protein
LRLLIANKHYKRGSWAFCHDVRNILQTYEWFVLDTVYGILGFVGFYVLGLW